MSWTREQYVSGILGPAWRAPAVKEEAEAFCPSNIALIKYWGKRPGDLNLPLVSSLSRSLGEYGTHTVITLAKADEAEMNGILLPSESSESRQIFAFLDLFRAWGEKYRVVTRNTVPTAAGVASSASGFAALLSALAGLKGWTLQPREMSMLARLGSGSAARSLWQGLVLWHKGEREDGLDCYAEPCGAPLPDFDMAVLLLKQGRKAVSSRDAMRDSLATSPLAAEWPVRQEAHLKQALKARDFKDLGAVVEENAVLLHEVMATAETAIVFDSSATVAWKARVREWRAQGMPVYFTQDAGPNLKVLFPPAARGRIAQALSAAQVDYLAV